MSRVLPILFNTDMVRAILDGRKTVTRRVIKTQPKFRLCYTFAGCNHGTWSYPNDTAYEFWGEEYRLPDCITDDDKKMVWKPPCHTDDVLYVRETWAPIYPDKESNEVRGYLYKEDSLEEYDKRYPDGEDYQWEGKWHPSIHMPKEAARIWLKVKDVRVERLQEMKPVDVIKEGAYPDCLDCLNAYGESGSQCCYGTEEQCSQCDEVMMEWEKLWNSTIKKSDLDFYGWNANPWVWVIEFERCEKPVDC